jgi:hypothetical protein
MVGGSEVQPCIGKLPVRVQYLSVKADDQEHFRRKCVPVLPLAIVECTLVSPSGVVEATIAGKLLEINE